MWVISQFFFPDEKTKLLVAVCYLIIFVIAFRRFNKLAVEYETFDAPENSRPWTTLFRFYSAGAIYFCLYVIVFAVMYRFFLKYPEFVKIAQEMFKSDMIAKKILPEIKDVPEYLYPILSTIILTVGVSKLKILNALEQNTRRFFQRLGSIPKQISDTIDLMQNSMMKIKDDACIRAMNDDLKKELRSHLRHNNDKFFERKYLVSRFLFSKIQDWDKKTSPYYFFRTVYQSQYDNVCSAYNRIDNDVQRYFNTLFELRATNESIEKLKKSSPDLIKSDELFKPLRKNRVELRNALKEIVYHMQVLIACAIHSEGFSEAARMNRLQQFGFQIPKQELQRESFTDYNDLALLSLLLLFVVPAAAIFFNSISGKEISSRSLSILVIWPAMAIWVGCVSILPMVLIKNQLETSTEGFWARLNKTSTRFNLVTYLLAGMIAFVAGSIGLTLLFYLDPKEFMTPFGQVYQKVGVWALIAFTVSIATGFNFDRTISVKKRMMWSDCAISAGAAVFGACAANLLASGKMNAAILFNTTTLLFVFPAAALIGGVVGAIFPHRYRIQKAREIKLEYRDVDLAQLINLCRHKMAERMHEKKIAMKLDTDKDLPNIQADGKLIEHVLYGLISNAFEYTAPEDTINIKAEKIDEENIQIAVSDDGMGIWQGQIIEIRDAFQEHDSTPIRYSIGSEIPPDLRQINDIVKRHGGDLNVEMNPSGGTVVKIRLPIVQLKESIAADISAIPRVITAEQGQVEPG